MKWKIQIAAAVVAWCICCSAASAQGLRENSGRSLFSDQKANRVGDAVTILVFEESSASNDSKSSMSRESQISLSASAKVGAVLTPASWRGVLPARLPRLNGW